MELGTGLAIVAFADQCLKYGNKFIKRCRSYLKAEEESIELLIAIESNWLKMETQIKILRKIAPELNKELQDMQSRILSQLEGKLKTASLTMDQLLKQKKEDEQAKMELPKHLDRDVGAMIQGLRGMKGFTKVLYTSKKKQLLQIVEDIEKWQARYDPTWILIMQMSIGNIDEELGQQQAKAGKNQVPLVIVAKGIRDAARQGEDGSRSQGTIWVDADEIDLAPLPIPFSPITMSRKGEEGMFLVDKMTSNPAANVNETTRKTRRLARILAEVDPTVFGLLKCKGVTKLPRTLEKQVHDFEFIFEVPPDLSNPRSLRAILIESHPYPLDERLELAKRLTSSVLFVHTVQFVHKNIRPETIIVFKNDESEIGAQFLAGFEQIRLEDGITYRAGDGLWERNLYRHISRQGLHPEIDYQMQHDIYSLGVVLLEIGLWKSFVDYNSDGQHPSPTANLLLGAEKKSPNSPIGDGLDVKKKLEALAELELPASMGKRYTDVVLSCLRCLDTGTDSNDEGFGVDVPNWKDEDGMVIGVRYIENVLEKIQGITL